MRSFNLVRLVSSTGLVLALLSGVAAASAQATTPEPTQDMMMAQMMSMPGACPPGMASKLLDNMMLGITEEPMMNSTEAMNMTQEPMMNATEAMNMTGTQEAMMGVTCLFGEFSGSAEVPDPGATGAQGVVFVSLDPASGMICYEEAVSGIKLPAAATHIHASPVGVSGDVVVPFPVAPGAAGLASGCTTTTGMGLAQAIASKPDQYYVNVHTTDFPKGAARAQLMNWNDAMMQMGMMMTPEAGASGSVTSGSTVSTPVASTPVASTPIPLATTVNTPMPPAATAGS